MPTSALARNSRAVQLNAKQLLTGIAALAAVPASGETATLRAEPIRTYAAEEANQGVAVGPERFYAIDNSRIAAYDRETGERVAEWTGDPEIFRHLNSCIVAASELVCAHSNYPEVPMAGSIEWFDAQTLQHLRSYSLGPIGGSLTWFVPRGGYWYAALANYDERGGEPGRAHRFTTLVEFDADFRKRQSWIFPDKVLERFAPRSSSGGAFGSDGLLYVTGHDRKEVYALSFPAAGSILNHEATFTMPTAGQAIAWDNHADRSLWSIDRANKLIVQSKIPKIEPD